MVFAATRVRATQAIPSGRVNGDLSRWLSWGGDLGTAGVTPAQLRAFAAIARNGTSKAAASELGVSEAAISGHVAALRSELGDRLFVPTASGLSFTPGGLRLAVRAVELLGLQDQTRREVRAAAAGERVLRLAVSSLFGEYYAPGLIELFSARSGDLAVEMRVAQPSRFGELLLSRAVDVAIGPTIAPEPDNLTVVPFMRYRLVVVVSERHRLAPPSGRSVVGLGDERWLLGPSAVDPASGAARILSHHGVSEGAQRIFQSHAAALTEARAGGGLAMCPASALATEVADGGLVELGGRGASVDGTWAAYTLGSDASDPASKLSRFATTPRAMRAMLSGSGADVARFRPRVHITLWS